MRPSIALGSPSAFVLHAPLYCFMVLWRGINFAYKPIKIYDLHYSNYGLIFAQENNKNNQ